jgi:hypothetical protein
MQREGTVSPSSGGATGGEGNRALAPASSGGQMAAGRRPPAAGPFRRRAPARSSSRLRGCSAKATSDPGSGAGAPAGLHAGPETWPASPNAPDSYPTIFSRRYEENIRHILLDS